jgi:uncharacterized short protein YbdD (DUF466 family)
MPWRKAWKQMVRTIHLMVGVPDYETYRAHRAADHPGEPVMDKDQFYRAATDRRFGGGAGRINRCC